jgi:hypothetical protein
MTKLNSGTREKLKNVSTATICTALFKRGLRNQILGSGATDGYALLSRLAKLELAWFWIRYQPDSPLTMGSASGSGPPRGVSAGSLSSRWLASC